MQTEGFYGLYGRNSAEVNKNAPSYRLRTINTRTVQTKAQDCPTERLGYKRPIPDLLVLRLEGQFGPTVGDSSS